MRALCLFAVLVLAKVLILAGSDIPLSLWMPLAFLWQDILFALGFAAIDSLLRRPKIAWGLYGIVALYVALNVPLCCTLSTPLTWPLLRAARGTLADSIAYHITAANLLRFMAVVLAAVLLPLAMRRPSRRLLVAAAIVGIVLAPLGRLATAHVETLGLHRNFFVALAVSLMPRVTALDQRGDWRSSLFGSPSAEDLIRFRGQAATRNVVLVHLESTGARYLRPYGASDDPMEFHRTF